MQKIELDSSKLLGLKVMLGAQGPSQHSGVSGAKLGLKTGVKTGMKVGVKIGVKSIR